MAAKDFVVKNGLQVQYNAAIGTSSVPVGSRLSVTDGNVNINTLGYGLVFPDNTFQVTAFSPDNTVLSFSAGSTGLTPNVATNGAIVLGGILNAASGGTGLGSYATGDLLFASSSTGLSTLSDVAIGNVLISGGVSVAPSWGKVGLTTHVDGVLSPINGGTGLSTFNANVILYASANDTWSTLASSPTSVLVTNQYGGPTYASGTTGNSILRTDGTSVSFAKLSLETDVAGTLPVGNGGTGGTTFTSNGVLYGNGTSAIQVTAQGSANTILVANEGAPSFSSSPVIGTSVTVPVVLGGSAGNSTLTLQSTSGTGTTDSILFKVGNNGSITAMTIDSDGQVGIGTTAISTATTQLGVYGGNIAIGSTSYGLIFPDGTFQTSAFSSSSAVTSFSGGITGLTPAVATAGAITLGGTLGLTNGGTNASLTANNGGIVWSNATQLQILSASATVGNVLISGGAGTPSWGLSYSSSNTPNTLVARDASGNFAAGTITADTGLSVTSGGATIIGATSITGNLSVTGNVLITGNINVVQSNVIVIDDPMIYIGRDNFTDEWDLGIVGSYTTDTYKHTGIVRNHLDDTWTIFDNLITEPSETLNWSQEGLEFGKFKVGTLNVAASTASIDTSTGSIITLGGIGIAGNINVGGSNSYFNNSIGIGTSSGTGINAGNTASVFGSLYTSGVIYANTSVNTNNLTMTHTVDITSTATSISTAPLTIDTFDSTLYRAAEYQISISSGAKYEITRLTVLHDGTTGYVTEYDVVATADWLATFDATVAGGVLSLVATPTYAATNFKISRKMWAI